MNVPFSLDHKLKWRSIGYKDFNISNTTLANKDTLIFKTMKFAQSMKDCSSKEDCWFMNLEISKITYLPHRKFMEMYNNMGQDYNLKT